MGEAVWWLILAALLVRSESAPTWGSSCPPQCSCHLSYIADLPLYHWLEGNIENKLPSTKEHHNEVFYEDTLPQKHPSISLEPNTLLKMAMCIFQGDAPPSMLLDELPSDTQVLSLLQGRNTGEVILEPQYLQGFQDLIYLDVQGYVQDDNKDMNNLILSSDVFRVLPSLQFLNLQHVKLLSDGEKDNKIHSADSSATNIDSFSNEISITLQENVKRTSRSQPPTQDPQNLVFLTPSASDSEVLPYNTYLEKKVQDGQRTFAGLTNLEFLRVYSCDLHEINWEMFDGLNKLLFLSLEKNHLLFIPEFAFYGTPNLQILTLSHNKLLNLQSTSLAGLLKLEKLDLSHNKFSHLSEFSLPPFPKLRTANFKHNPIEAIFASTFEIMNATTTLFIGGNSSVLDIQPNSFLGLQSLEKLHIDNISISLLERQLLSGMPQLKELEIFGTIKALSFDAFIEVPNLEKLILKECRIESVSMDAFYGLYGLLVLDLSSNLLETLPPGLFDQQFSLTELYLQNNLLKELPVGFFKNLPAKMVRLEGNSWHCSCGMKDWPSSVINRVKQKKRNRCQKEYDKGNACDTSSEEIYVYEKKMTPLCTTPRKYLGWSVFQVLRKELRCTKKLKMKANRNFYLRKKHEDYEKLMKTSYYDKASKDNTGYGQEYSKPQKEMSVIHENTTDRNQIIAANVTKAINTTHPTLSVTQNNVASEELNELNPIANGNDFLKFQDHEATKLNNIISDVNKPTFYKTNFKKLEQIESGVNKNSGQQDAKALKKAWKLEMEKNHQKKLLQYYSKSSV